MRNENTKTLIVAGILCLVCSILVSGTAITLKPLQDINRDIDFKKNILLAANVVDSKTKGDEILEKFKSVTTLLVSLEDGSIITDIDPETYDDEKTPQIRIPINEDIAGLVYKPSITKVFVMKDSSGEIESIVLPIVSQGLWAAMYGFMALEADANTVKGITYYEHGETPGLGGEVDNPKWKALWHGKKIYDDNDVVKLHVAKRTSDQNFDIDAISGATITGNGINSSLKFWFGETVYKPFLENLKAQEI